MIVNMYKFIMLRIKMEIRYDLDIREIRNPIILGQYKLFYLGF